MLRGQLKESRPTLATRGRDEWLSLIHIFLLQKDLGVIERGIIEGRRTYGNLLKYLKTTAVSYTHLDVYKRQT